MTEPQKRFIRAATTPQSFDREKLTAEIVMATDALEVDHVKLRIREDLGGIELPKGPLPILQNHTYDTSAQIGWVDSIRHTKVQGGLNGLVGTAHFHEQRSGDLLDLIQAGAMYWSVGFSVKKWEPIERSRKWLATGWRLLEVSATPTPADPNAVTRSLSQIVMTTTNPSSISPDATGDQAADDDISLSRSELKRQRDITRAVSEAKLDPELADQLIRSGRPLPECTREIVRQLRIKLEGGDVTTGEITPIGHPAADPTFVARAEGEPADPLARSLYRAMRGQPLARPLVEELKAAGYAGRSGAEVVRAAFATGKRNAMLRGFHSTSDAKDLLLSTGDRLLQERHQEAPRGILELARIRTLADFREASVIDAGLVGGAVQLAEGAEIKYGSLNSEAGKYKPSRYGLGLSFTFEALQNDDLGGIDAVLQEVSQTMLESEAASLGELLHGPGALGGICPDGLELFDAAHNNIPSSPATLSVDGLAAMVELLRRQTSVGGRKIWLSPGYVLVGPDLETTALQLLSEAWQAAAPDDTNPWKSLRLIVDPTVEEGFFYMVASGSRKPFELGRVDGMPMMRQEEDFNTSGMKMKVEHAYGCACVDHRVIVRNKASA